MPWKIEKRGDKFVVVNRLTKRVVGKHHTKKQADKQMKALHANVKHMM